MANVVLWPWVKVVGVIIVVTTIMFSASKFFGWAQKDIKLLYRDVDVPDINWYEIKQYILNNYKNNIQGTIWEEI